MRLACKTAEVLALATHALTQLMSNQHDLRSTDERMSALTQLATTVHAAAKLADVAHMDALTAHGRGAGNGRGDTDGLMTEGIIRAQTQRLKAVAEKAGKDAERAAVEKTERIKSETEKVSKEVEKSVAETARLHAEAEKVARETERAKAEAGRAVAETERLKAEAMMVRSVKLKIDAETEREKVGREPQLEAQKADEEAERAVAERAVSETQGLTVETGQSSTEEKRVGEEVESSGQVQEGHGQKPRRTREMIYAELEQKQIEMLTDGNPLRWPQLTKEIRDLRLEARSERLRRDRYPNE